MKKLVASVVALPLLACGVPGLAQESEFDVRARETEQAPLASREACAISAIRTMHR
jgi:hypothetical protein